jgi:hypothetical protein
VQQKRPVPWSALQVRFGSVWSGLSVPAQEKPWTGGVLLLQSTLLSGAQVPALQVYVVGRQQYSVTPPLTIPSLQTSELSC